MLKSLPKLLLITKVSSVLPLKNFQLCLNVPHFLTVNFDGPWPQTFDYEISKDGEFSSF